MYNHLVSGEYGHLLSVIYDFSNSFVSAADFEFLVAEGEILNFRRFKAMNVGLKSMIYLVQPALNTCLHTCPGLFESESTKKT